MCSVATPCILGLVGPDSSKFTLKFQELRKTEEAERHKALLLDVAAPASTAASVREFQKPWPSEQVGR